MFKKYEDPRNYPKIYLDEQCLNIYVASMFEFIKCCILTPSKQLLV